MSLMSCLVEPVHVVTCGLVVVCVREAVMLSDVGGEALLVFGMLVITKMRMRSMDGLAAAGFSAVQFTLVLPNQVNKLPDRHDQV